MSTIPKHSKVRDTTGPNDLPAYRTLKVLEVRSFSKKSGRQDHSTYPEGGTTDTTTWLTLVNSPSAITGLKDATGDEGTEIRSDSVCLSGEGHRHRTRVTGGSAKCKRPYKTRRGTGPGHTEVPDQSTEGHSDVDLNRTGRTERRLTCITTVKKVKFFKIKFLLECQFNCKNPDTARY